MRNIIITGATSGIGESLARKLASDKGNRIALLARKKGKLDELREELGEQVETIVCDVRDYAGVQSVISDLQKRWGKIDVLVNNAGLGFFDPFLSGKIEEWHEMVDVNIKGLLNCIHAALPHLLVSEGLIINMGSVASHFVFPNSGVYCATKHAVFAISESIRMEMPGKVRVTTISPGSTNTPFVDRFSNPEMLKEYKEYFAGGISADLVADQVIHAMNAPAGSVISEIIVRPARSVK